MDLELHVSYEIMYDLTLKFKQEPDFKSKGS